MNALLRLWRPWPASSATSAIAKPMRAGRPSQIRHESSKPPSPSRPVEPSPSPSQPINEQPPTDSKRPLWERLGPLTRAAHAYGRSQRRRPYVTQVCSSLVIAFCADMSVQRMNRRGHGSYDPTRTARSLAIGGMSSIPSYLWFTWLALNFNFASSRVLSLLAKVAINQVVFTPVFNTYFFGMQALLAGEGVSASWTRVCQTVPTSVVNSVKVWPAVTAVNFTFVPLEYRSLFAGVFAVGWQTYLMYLNRKAEDAEATAVEGAFEAVEPVSSVSVASTASVSATSSAVSAVSSAAALSRVPSQP